LRIIVHDFAGHPFEVQLSRALARRGYDVLHHFLDDDQSPKGAMNRQPTDPPTFRCEGLRLANRLDKTNYFTRLRQDFEYGYLAAKQAQEFNPDIYISANMPLDSLNIIKRRMKRDGAFFVFWQQDFYSLALSKILPSKMPVIGNMVATRYRRLEQQIARDVDSIVCISDDFYDQLRGWGVDVSKAVTIENWAALDEIEPVTTRPTAWAHEQGLADCDVVLYTGTLGLKHNPEALWRLAERLAARPRARDTRVVVCSQGVGADWLQRRLEETPLPTLRLLPFQPYERLSEVLGSATLVTALLEPDAGVFSVPSKVLSYMAAGRPILLAAPAVNLASRTVVREDAGRVVDPTDADAFVAAALDLLDDPVAAEAKAANGRRYAEHAFDIERIADSFESLWRPSDGRALAG
jgi:glycosyltransferase involved in cell wall biosynthesis